MPLGKGSRDWGTFPDEVGVAGKNLPGRRSSNTRLRMILGFATVVALFNRVLSWLLDAAFWPFQTVDPIWALLIVSLMTGLLILWAFARVSNQATIGLLKRRIRGNLLAVRLYQHDLKIVARLQWTLLKDTLGYLKCSLRPMLVLIVPIILIMAQLNLRFAERPIRPGESTVVKAKVGEVSFLNNQITLEAPDGVSVETPGVRVGSDSEIAWRVRSEEPGLYSLRIHTGSQTVEKEFHVSRGSWATVSAYRAGNLGEMLLYPGEPLIHPSGKIESVEVNYPQLRFLGRDLNWLVLFFVFSAAFAFAFSRILRVEI